MREKQDRSIECASQQTHGAAFELLRAHLPAGRVLDIPCGAGAFADRLRNVGYEAVAGDIVSDLKFPDLDFCEMDMNARLPLDDASFDAVVSIEGIEHLERPFDFVRECVRVLRPGGYLLITTPNISALRSRWRWFLTGFHNKAKYPLDEANPAPHHHINMLSFPALRYMLHANGARIEKVTTNRVKAISWVYAPLLPLHYLVSRASCARGAENAAHGEMSREVFRQMMSLALLFGETQVVLARRVS